MRRVWLSQTRLATEGSGGLNARSTSTIGHDLAAAVADSLGQLATEVEYIGSTAVPRLLAKPIIDLAIGVTPGSNFSDVERQLTATGWIYRGDAGDSGGHVFVLESQPGFRIAHAHGVPHGGLQWNQYIEFRELLRADPLARNTYTTRKALLLAGLRGDEIRSRYTEQKTSVVEALLSGRHLR